MLISIVIIKISYAGPCPNAKQMAFNEHHQMICLVAMYPHILYCMSLRVIGTLLGALAFFFSFRN